MMPSSEDLLLLNEISVLLKNRFADFTGLYFFGSRLNGYYSADSDFDILLVFNREIDYSFKREVRDLIYDIMLEHDIIIDTKIFSEYEIQYPQMPFTEEVKNNGFFYAV